MNDTCTINPCRPGFGASCALCCGSHNYDASREEIESLFQKRRKKFRLFSSSFLIKQLRASRSNLTGSYYPDRTIDNGIIITIPKLYEDGLQCPFVCLLDDGTVGCAIYPAHGEDDMRFDCFQNYTCKYFSCASKKILIGEEILYAARLFRDWYYYTLFIHSIDIIRKFRLAHPIVEKIEESALTELKQLLDASLRSEKNLYAISSYFT